MKIRVAALCLLVLSSLISARGQSHENYRTFLTQQVRSPKLPGPQHLRDYVHDGKLELSLHDAIVLTLENNSAIHVEEASVETAKFSLLRTYQPFDPQLQSQYNATYNSTPNFGQIQGAGASNATNQFFQANFTQTLQTGTLVLLGFNNFNSVSKYLSTPLNYDQSFLNLQITQPLLRNRWLFENRAPLIIARKSLQQSRSSFEAQVSLALQTAIGRYWAVVLAHGNLEVVQQSLDAAQASYAHAKRALELGALPPLDIYRSEATVASRRVQVLEAEYTLKQVEDDLRFTIGANQDEYVHALDLDLTEKPEPLGELRTIDAGSALEEALLKRPEVQVAQRALEKDDTSVRLAHNHLLPDLQVSAQYTGSGFAGNGFSGTSIPGGLGTSLNQLFTFGAPGYGATVTLNLPIKNRAAQADLGLALVTRHSDLYTMQQVREQIVLDVNTAVRQLEEAKLTLEASKTALDLAQKTLAADQRKYELGQETQDFFLLNSQTQVADARQSLLQAQIGYQNAAANVDWATGNMLATYQVQIADMMK